MQLTTLATIALAAGAVAAAPSPQMQKRCSGGQATYYNAGLGNCGWTNSNSDWIVALPTAAYANGAHCGQKISVKNTQNGKQGTAIVSDSCPSCESYCSLDLSEGFWSYLNDGNMAEGEFPVEWNLE